MKSQIKPYSIRNATLKNFEAKHTKAHATDSLSLLIKSRKNLCLLSVLNSYHSRTCLPENVCKFLFHCYFELLRACGVRCECNGVLYAMADKEYY
ncbi:hypothetical protein T4D_3362 [Trichinella pseudospiralis]|uniref:Uncharacterized protein n=1 Tax=Trichinella pseudospiralis TaxID=6337 RepID=A0A0V1FKP0_TRIPS|nr:hypothetical protein T4D_3362 [Trichinella pseudospiralis]